VEPVPQQVYAMDWSPDGKLVAYVEWKPSGTALWMLPLEGDHKPYLLFSVPQAQALSFRTIARFSPDGKWLAYSSKEVCATRSRIVGMPNGLCFPSGLGM